ncbi:transposable element Tc1 transposase [Trichonephila clavipes]|nr:transposable element Tc1 transposase [Trichonephila clavipes]
MLTGIVQCLATNCVTICALTIIEDVSGDGQGSLPILLSLLLAPGSQQGVMVWSAISFEAGIIWSSLQTHLQHSACQTLPWPARLPAFSPIEQVWDMMGKRIHLPGNVDNIAQELEHIWQEIPQETLKLLYQSMPRRVAA